MFRPERTRYRLQYHPDRGEYRKINRKATVPVLPSNPPSSIRTLEIPFQKTIHPSHDLDIESPIAADRCIHLARQDTKSAGAYSTQVHSSPSNSQVQTKETNLEAKTDSTRTSPWHLTHIPIPPVPFTSGASNQSTSSPPFPHPKHPPLNPTLNSKL
ncbi:hypothetical protein K402DRAFT_389170 [Aulographum hederae CBS 113979]|uniref:Uncharacterized protein n=1 Tax=Aulographum hederae CBS 113979 TaxID=1176131 RepID=A0A6G1HD36_9PEZI|nr:hypothetical protein K402DRAFT_389170 [Aulographum hederae CBS 113979]